ncbi:MAG: rhomboid family intramembrane serine protease [Candidatus Aureabacteria bacterium]|nr:rhomboid family intramembrane serine protease [Candidatus Auribacterota bacterium]
MDIPKLKDRRPPERKIFPNFTVLITVASVIVSVVKWMGYNDYAVYNRTTLFVGQIWRLWTCHLDHFTLRQFFTGVIPFVIAGTIIEKKKFPFFISLYFVSATFISAVVFFFYHNVQYYSGLSGVTMATVVFLCLHSFKEESSWRWLYVMILLGTLTIIGLELAHGQSFAAMENEPHFLVPSVHLTGVLSAVFVFFVFKKRV